MFGNITHDHIAVCDGTFKDDRVACARETTAAASAIIVGGNDEFHIIGHRLAFEHQVDDAACIRVYQLTFWRETGWLRKVNFIRYAVHHIKVVAWETVVQQYLIRLPGCDLVKHAR